MGRELQKLKISIFCSQTNGFPYRIPLNTWYSGYQWDHTKSIVKHIDFSSKLWFSGLQSLPEHQKIITNDVGTL